MKEEGVDNSAKYTFAQFQVRMKGKASACTAKEGIEAWKLFQITLCQSGGPLNTFDLTKNQSEHTYTISLSTHILVLYIPAYT